MLLKLTEAFGSLLSLGIRVMVMKDQGIGEAMFNWKW
jgi:hypothetical protein